MKPLKQLIVFFSLVGFILFFVTKKAHSQENTLKVAIIDTGLDLSDPRLKDHLCSTGHKDFTETQLRDVNGHGTHIAGLIEKYSGNGNYCLLIYKYYQDRVKGIVNQNRELLALEEAVKNGANIVNFSGGGPGFDAREYAIIRNNPKVTFVVAAGNEGHDLDIPGNEFYPASYFLKNEKIVENRDVDGFLSNSSNYGSRVTDSEVGAFVRSTMPGGFYGVMSGSSQSTAIATGKLIRKLLDAK